MTRQEYEYKVVLPQYEELEYTKVRCARLKDWDKCYYADGQRIPKSLVHSITEIEKGHELLVKSWYVEKENIDSFKYERFIKN